MLTGFIVAATGCATQSENLEAAEISPAQHDMTWFCASDDAARSVMVTYPLRGAANVQMGGQLNMLASVKLGKEEGEDGRETIRFDFNEYNESFIIITGDRDESTNVYRAGYYNFMKMEDGATTTALQYVCLSRIGPK